MAVDTMEMDAPQVDEQQTPQPDPVEKYYNYLKQAGADVAPSLDSFKKTLSNDSTAQKYYNYLRQNKFDAPPTYGSFARTLGVKQAGTPTSAPTPPATPAAPPVPEHEVQHDPIQDIRHVKEMADRPISGTTLVTGPYYDPNAKVGNAEEVAQTKAYTAQYDKMANDLGTQWGAKPEVVKQVLNDFPDEQNQDKLKANAQLAKDNPVSYGRLKNANDIRIGIAQDGPNGIHDANVFNHLLDATDYDQLTSENIPYQIQLMREHNMGQADIEKLKTAQRPLINSTDPGLLQKYWTSSDKELGLSPDEYAGLETERLFNPNKAAMDMASLKHARGIGDDGKANPLDMSTQPYEYQRGIENIKYNLQNTGRDNLARYISEYKPQVDKQMEPLRQGYNEALSFESNQQAQQKLIQEFNDHPVVQEANRLENAQQGLQYSESEDKRRYPLNFADQATRAVSEAMDKTAGFGSNVATLGGNVLQGAGETSDNTIRFVKNMAINILGSDESKAFNNAKDIGHQSLTELAAYEPTSYTGTESPILVPRETQQAVQNILNGPGTDEEKQQKAISYISDNFADLKANPKAGQQNITGKAALFQAANVMGQILGVANQSFLLGGVIGDASKLQQMATAFTPMYMSTQNQMYEQALQRGDEHPLLKSNIDATILSLASLINPDIKVVKGMVGAESGVGKMIAGIDESTWNKVLSENKPLVDRMIGAAKATGRQLGLANLQYGVIAPVAQYAAHKSILDEDANLGDMIKDAVVQTSISMALPSLLHGVWGGKSATEVNPQQKFAIVEVGLHSDQNIDLIESKIKAGTMPEIQGHEMKQLIKHAGEILQNSEMVKTDGTPMNEKEVADNVYSMLRKAVLEKKLKTAAEPIKPIIEDQIHEVNKEIADLHTADPNKADLNQLLHDNLDKIDQKNQLLANIIKQHIAANEPEAFFRTIANEVKTENGKENGDVGKIEEKYGKPLVDKAIELSKQKSTTNGEKINNNAQPEGQVVQPKERAETIATDKGAPSIRPTAEFRTWNLGDMEGKPEDEAAKKHLEGVVEKWDQHPAGETGGEPFGKFVDRVIPAFDKVLKEGDDNTTIVTHSSVLKAMRVWDEMGRPDVENLTPEQKKTFADKYNETETHNGDLETFKGDKGDIHVIRHGQTEDNEKNNFRSGDTPLTQKGVQDAAVAGQELKDKTGGNVPQIITSDLPRTIHSSNIINDKLKENATNNSQAEGGQENQASPEQSTINPEPEQSPQGSTAANNPQGSEQDVNQWPFNEKEQDLPVGIKKVISESQRVQWNLPEVDLPKLAKDDEILRAGKEAVDSGKINPREVAARVAAGGGIYTPAEGGAMLYYAHQLREAETNLRGDLHEANDLLKKDPDNTAAFYAKLTAEQRLGQLDDEIDLSTKANRVNSNSWGGLGNIMQIETDSSFSPARVRAVIQDNYGGKIPEKVQEKIDKANAERDKAISDLKAAKDKVALMELQKDAAKEKQTKDPKTVAERKAALKEERSKLIEDLKKAIKKDTGNLGANPLPINTIEAVSKLALNYFKDGVVTLEGLTNKIYNDLKDVVDGIDKNQIREAVSSYQPLRTETRKAETERIGRKADNIDEKLKTGEIEPTKRTPILNFEKDTDYIKAKQRLINAEYALKQEKLKSYASKESRVQKTLGWANRLMRLSVLSGVKVLEKLAAAATIGSASQKPIEEVLNGIWGHVFPKIRGKADTDMGMNASAVGQYYSHFFNPIEFARDTKDIIKSGETQLGKELDSHMEGHIPILDLPTDLHQVIKGPAKRAMFQYALTKIVDAEQKKGVDINHPLVIESARQRAFARAKYEIFMEDNSISRQFGKWESQWREEANSNDPLKKAGGASKSFLLHFVFPVSKVPTNIARRVGLYAGGLPIGLTKAARAYKMGIENLTPEEANTIGKALTKGTIGTALWMAGFFGYKSLGGLYSKFDPNKQRKNESLADEMKLMGQPVSKPWQHAIPFEVMQLGATFRHIYEKSKTKDGNAIAVAKATMGSTGAILEQIPVVETPVNMISATTDPYMAKKLGEDLKRRGEPQLLKDLGVIKEDKKKPISSRGSRGR